MTDPPWYKDVRPRLFLSPVANPFFVQYRDDAALLEHLDARGVAVGLPVEGVRHARVDDQLRAHHAGRRAHEYDLVAHAARSLDERVHLRVNAPAASRHGRIAPVRQPAC